MDLAAWASGTGVSPAHDANRSPAVASGAPTATAARRRSIQKKRQAQDRVRGQGKPRMDDVSYIVAAAAARWKRRAHNARAKRSFQQRDEAAAARDRANSQYGASDRKPSGLAPHRPVFHVSPSAADAASENDGDFDLGRPRSGSGTPQNRLRFRAKSRMMAKELLSVDSDLLEAVQQARLDIARRRRTSMLHNHHEDATGQTIADGHAAVKTVTATPRKARSLLERCCFCSSSACNRRCACPSVRAPFARIASHRWFDRVMIVVILLNCVFLAATDPLDTDMSSTRNRVLEAADLVFLGIYSLEMFIKCMAFGMFLGDRAYIKQTWNLIDGALVVVGWIGYLPFFPTASLSSIRIVRVLRPLKTVQSVPGLKLLVNSMLASLPQLGNVLFLCAFLFVLFGIIGVQIFGGRMDQRCVVPTSDSTFYFPPSEEGFLCSLDGGVRQCGVDELGNQTQCLGVGPRPNDDITHFDHIGVAFLTIFQCITMEGWVDVMYWLEETGMLVASLVYFNLLIIMGAIFLINLVVAVIVTTLSVENDIQWEENLEAEAKSRGRAVSDASSLGGSAATGITAGTPAVGATPRRRRRGSVGMVSTVERRRRRNSGESDNASASVAPLNVGVPMPTQHTGRREHASSVASSVQPVETGDSCGDSCNRAEYAAKRSPSGAEHPSLGSGDVKAARHLQVSPEPALHRGNHSGEFGSLVVTSVVESPTQDSGGDDDDGGSPSASAMAQEEAKSGADGKAAGNLPTIEATDLQTRLPSLRVTPKFARPKLAGFPSSEESGNPTAAGLCKPAGGSGGGGGGSGGSGGTTSAAATPVSMPASPIVSSSGNAHHDTDAESKAQPTVPKLRLNNTGGVAQSSAFVAAPAGAGGVASEGGGLSDSAHVQVAKASAHALSQQAGAPRPLGQTHRRHLATHATGSMNFRSDELVVIDGHSDVLGHSQEHSLAVFDAVAVATPKNRVSKWHRRLVDSSAFRITIIVLIILNTVLLALEHHDMRDWMASTLDVCNIALTAAFALEMALKHIGYGVRGYWSDSFNVFDGIIVIVSLVEICLVKLAGVSAGGGVSALRALRLLRVLKLARSWESLNEILVAMASSLVKIAPFSIILVLFMFIYSLLGMQVFGGKLGSPAPRMNYDSLLWSFVTTFQVLTGENWNEAMYLCISHVGWSASIYFISEVVLGTYVVLNLFLAILIDHFTELSEQRDISKLEQLAAAGVLEDVAVESAISMVAPRPTPAMQQLLKTASSLRVRNDVEMGDLQTHGDNVAALPPAASGRNLPAGVSAELSASGSVAESRRLMAMKSRQLMGMQRHQNEMDRSAKIQAYKSHARLRMKRRRRRRHCCGCNCDRFERHPSFHNTSLGLVSNTNCLRVAIGDMVLHPVFEGFITVLIAIGCVSLAMDSVQASQELVDVLWIINLVLTALFTLEMLLKMFAFGVVRGPGAYIKDPWNRLDLFIVLISLLDIGLDGTLRFIKVLRFLRALRPLRAVKRLRGLRVVINAVVRAFPGAFNVAMVCVLFFFLYGIMGVNFFAGKFYSCTDPSRTCLPRLAGEHACPAALACNGTWVPSGGTAAVAREWVNPAYADGRGVYSFDNSVVALMTLFEVASLELWHEVMYTSADVVGVGFAPERNANQGAVFFYVIFIMFGSLFMLNLFVSVVVDNFRKMKQAEAGGSVFMTETQQQWVEMQTIISRMRPAPLAAPPTATGRFRREVFHLVAHPYFDITIMCIIMANVAVMCTQHADQEPVWDDVAVVANYIFGFIFLVEMVVKHVGLGVQQYWSSWWNCFDGLLVITNVTTVFIRELAGETLALDVTLFRVIRVFRIFRLVKTVPQLRLIFTTLMLSLPSMANVGTLLVLLFFMYAVMGMSLFGDVATSVYIDEHTNFRNFGRALMVLVRMATGESWNGIMHDCMTPGDLMSEVVAYLYFSTFVVLGQFMMINLFVAVILENFEREFSSDSTAKVTSSDLEFFADLWAAMPRKGKLRRDRGHLSFAHFKWFLFRLGIPLGFDPVLDCPTYRMEFLGALNVKARLINGELCVEYQNVLEELVKHVIATASGAAEELDAVPNPNASDSEDDQMGSLREAKDWFTHTTRKLRLTPREVSFRAAELAAATVLQRAYRRRKMREKWNDVTAASQRQMGGGRPPLVGSSVNGRPGSSRNADGGPRLK